MTTYPLRDSTIMLRRNLRRATRSPVWIVSIIGLPVIFLLLFAYVFGDTLGAGLGALNDRGDYVTYMSAGIILIAVAGSTQGTAIAVALDKEEGIIARFKTMAIARTSVLTGHVLGSLIQTLIGLAVVIGVALLVGFRPTATPTEWVAAVGLLMLLALGLTWLSVGMGLKAKTVEGASNFPLPLSLLPLLGSGFVPTDTMPVGLRWFAEYQPFTPMMDTLRGLLIGPPIGNSWWIAIAWCVGIGLVGYLWAKNLYNRDWSEDVG